MFSTTKMQHGYNIHSLYSTLPVHTRLPFYLFFIGGGVINYLKKIIKINNYFKKILLCRKWKF